MAIDDFVSQSLIHPKALNIDVEGAELLVLKGAQHTLYFDRPFCWVSIHPDLLERNYQSTPEDIHRFMSGCRYTQEFLDTDHEEHWFYRPEEK